jgi:HSP20 family protein
MEVGTMAERKKPETTKSDGNKQGNGSQRRALTRQEGRSLGSPYQNPLGRLRSEFDRLFDDFFQGWPTLGGSDRDRGWQLDVQDREDAVVVRADAPGFEPSDFDVEVRGDNLVLCACQSEEESEEAAGYRWQQRELYRSVPLPAEIDADKIDAEYRNGVLTVTLPKSEPAKSRKIEIKG